MGVIIKTEGLSKSYFVGKKEVPILHEIDVEVNTGEFVSIMGPSGCGKSTLLYLLGAIDVPSSGKVLLNGEDIHKMKDKRKSMVRRREIGFVFQFYNLVQNLTVSENILLPLIMDGKKAVDHQRRLDEILAIVGLSDRKKYTPRELSGGQQQRVAIARALIQSPKLILADEPIGNLDSKTGTEIMELFHTINEQQGITIIQVTHSEEAAKYGNRIIRMKDGGIEGTVSYHDSALKR